MSHEPLHARDPAAEEAMEVMEEIDDRARMKSSLIYEIIRHEGEEELRRPLGAPWWSGVAAGLSIGLSVLAVSHLRALPPPTDWRPAIENLGCTVGFPIVILGRQPLFTENTITAVAPVPADLRWPQLGRLARLWGVVFAANIVGAMLFAAFLVHGGALDPAVLEAARALGEKMTAMGPADLFVRGIVAGWLMAAIVWTIPNAEASKALIILILTYLIALGDLSHVIAGSVEVGLLAIEGSLGPVAAPTGFLIPVLAGNVVGGTVLFTLLTYGQVRREILDESPARKDAPPPGSDGGA